MKNTTFKRIISMVLVCMMLVGTLAGISVSADTATTVEFVSNNVLYGENLKLMYAVQATNLPDGATIVVTLSDGENTYETVPATAAQANGAPEGATVVVSKLGVPAQNIDAVLTATAQVIAADGKTVLAEATKDYSVLEYLNERLYVTAGVEAAQKEMYNALIAYAAAADVVINGADSISTYAYVVLNGKGGMYTIGDTIELTTDLVAGEGEEIVWTVNGEKYTEATYTVAAGFANIVAEVVANGQEPEEPEWTVEDALVAEDDTEIILTATVESIYQAYSSQYDNISVYLTDATGARIIAFRMKGNVNVGDLITVTGTITTYEETGVKQLAQGCTFEMVEVHDCADYATEATCTSASVCSSCGKELAPALTHPTDENGDGICDYCGIGTEVSTTTVTVVIADLADANGWANGVQYSSFAMDANITVTANGTSNTGKYYTSGENWRIYQGESGTVTITAAEGKTIVSVKITYASQNNGTLTYNSSNVASGDTVEVNANSITFGAGSTSGSKGQARISAIEVVYA